MNNLDYESPQLPVVVQVYPDKGGFRFSQNLIHDKNVKEFDDICTDLFD
jgi:hypothetical protein